LFIIPPGEIDAMKVDKRELEPFAGTLKVHQYRWSREKPKEIRFKTPTVATTVANVILVNTFQWAVGQ